VTCPYHCKEGYLVLGSERVGNEIRYIYSDGCPWKRVTPFAKWCGQLFAHYRNGFLLRAGGIDDQPQWYLEAMSLMATEMNRIEAMKVKQAAKS